MNEALIATIAAIGLLCIVFLVIVAMDAYDESEYQRIMRERDWE